MTGTFHRCACGQSYVRDAGGNPYWQGKALVRCPSCKTLLSQLSLMEPKR